MNRPYEDWIGRRRLSADGITARMIAEYKLTLGDLRGPGDVPPGFHWCLAPDRAAAADLGRDGHPRPGIFLPELPLPRRMWAGGEVRVLQPFQDGDRVERTTTIADVTFKQGRSGDLGFVTVLHDYHVAGTLCLSERQDIVYRPDRDPAAPQLSPPPGGAWTPCRSWHVTPDATLLFRYSAITFNGHRIHYDFPYATGVEGYDGLVVHGPLQSTWMQNLAATIFGAPAANFAYRGLSPLIAGHAVTIEAQETAAGLELRVRRDADGVVTMQAQATAP